MQKASVIQGSGLKLPKEEPTDEVHVFGKNLEERVVKKDDESPSISSFNILAPTAEKEEENIEAIRERKFDAKTGEEDETTKFQGEFKLFIWDLTTSNWIERGRGQLKLNDSNEGGKEKSRLIMRVSGTLKIILNVAISSSHFKILASSKTNIRFSDGQSVWAASGSNVNQLRDLIDQRLIVNPKRSLEVVEDETTPTKRTKADDDKDVENRDIPRSISEENQKSDELEKKKNDVTNDSNNDSDGQNLQNEQKEKSESKSSDNEDTNKTDAGVKKEGEEDKEESQLEKSDEPKEGEDKSDQQSTNDNGRVD